MPDAPNTDIRHAVVDDEAIRDLTGSTGSSPGTASEKAGLSLSRRVLNKFQKANRIRGAFGIVAMLQHAMSSIGGRLVNFEAYIILWLHIDDVQVELNLPTGIEMRFLTAAEVESFARDPVYELTTSHIEKVRAGTDHCFAALSNGRLASYGQYTTGALYAVGDHGLVMRSPAQAAHTHSGFTHPDFRGRRLHGLAKIHALHALSERGIDTLLSDVSWANRGSLKSLTRAGYKVLGNLYSLGRGRLHFVSVPKAARSRGVEFERRG